jgi:5'-3' exonuclease
MDVYLVDGTYELFRHFFALPPHVNRDGKEVAAARGALSYFLSFLESDVTHLGVATDHVIESFRNDMWAAYKTAAGVDRRLLDQFPLLEQGMSALGIANWPMVELEADDGLAAAAAFADSVPEVERVYICSPDKDLGQCVRGERVVQLLDRRSGKLRDAAGVVERFGVAPESIPDYLALMGDSADGYPGLPGWGAKSAAAVLSRYGHLEAIPSSAGDWQCNVRGADKLGATLNENRELVLLFRDLATLRTHKPALTSTEELRWLGPTPELVAFSDYVEMPALLQRAQALARRGL